MKKIISALLVFSLLLPAGSALAGENRVGVGAKVAVYNSFAGSVGLRFKLPHQLIYEMNYLVLPAQFNPEGVPYNYFDLTLLYSFRPENQLHFAAGIQMVGVLRESVAGSFPAGLFEARYSINENYLGRLFISLPYPGGTSALGFGLGVDYF